MELIDREEVHDLIAKRLSDYLTDETRKELEELDIRVEEDIPTVQAVPIEVLYELKEEISKLESGWYWRSVSENDVTSFDKDTLSYVHKLIDEKIKELSK